VCSKEINVRPRATKDLCQLSSTDFFGTLSEGLTIIARNVDGLWNGALTLQDNKQFHGARVLRAVAEEEAAKFLILLDAVRCPNRDGLLAGQLDRFGNHLAKGLYARACGMRPVSLGQLQEYMDDCRRDFYLDGPTGADWILRNEIFYDREGALYVDYVDVGGDRYWLDPADTAATSSPSTEPAAVQLLRHLHDAGFATASALAVVADVWHPLELTPDTHCTTVRSTNRETLERLDDKELLNDIDARALSFIVTEWQFPMYSLDLSLIKVDKERLRELQAEWDPND
jgi:AbiV family abortive infection protein